MDSLCMTRSAKVCAGLLVLTFSTPLLAQDGDAKRGEVVFQQCSICHQVGPMSGNGVGPNLTGVLNRKIGSIPDYSYGTGLQKAAQAGLSWDEEKVFNWLADPQTYIKRIVNDDSVTSKMPVKFSDEQARWDVIAYIATFGEK